MRSRRPLALVVVASLAVAACASDDDDAGTNAPATSAAAGTATSAVDTDTPADETEPSATAQAALDEVLGWLAEPSTIDATRFNQAFLAEVTPEDLGAGIESLGVGTWAATDVEAFAPDGLVATLTGPGPGLTVTLVVDEDELIDTLVFEFVGLTDPPTSFTDLTSRLQEAGDVAGFVAAEVDESGACRATETLAADTPLPIGSAFKLYVLGAVATAVTDGRLTWEQAVPIRDELDSLPSGITQDEPVGTTLTVRELAQRMIEISDNTATDILMDLVGRDAVEATLAGLGHGDPAVTLPLLTTRELFTIKLDAELLGRYDAADEAGRRQLLADEVAGRPLPELDLSWTTPRSVLSVEWFASPLDICRALVSLDEVASEPGLEPLTEILTTNPGIAFDPAQYDEVQFKGGSEPGVLFGSWLATRPDGSRVVVAGGVTSGTSMIDPVVIELVGSGLALAADG